MPRRLALPPQGVSKSREISGAVFMKPAFCELATNACTDARGISLVKIMRFHACSISSADMSWRVSAINSAFTIFLCFLRILQNPVGEFPMCLPEFIRELAIFIEKLHTRDEYRRRGVGFLDQYLAAGFVFKPRYPWLNRPYGVGFLLLKKRKLIGILRRQHLRVATELRNS